MRLKAVIGLADGSYLYGYAYGHYSNEINSTEGEMVFNTAMSGYQEIMTDPSYSGQIIVFTYPHIGNVGINKEDYESKRAQAAGFVIRDISPIFSNWRAEYSLEDFLNKNKILAITGIDTRMLTRKLRDKGCQNCCILSFTEGNEELAAQAAIEKARQLPAIDSNNLAQISSCGSVSNWQEDLGNWDHTVKDKSIALHIIVYDCGVKYNILRTFKEHNVKVTLVPYESKVESLIKQHQPDGVLFSNGPGDPKTCEKAINDIKYFLEQKIPLLGICLGHQLLGIACGAKTQKMKFGHHGANHPVKREKDNSLAISSQNHNFTLEESSLAANIKVTHRSLFDNSIQGIELIDKPAIGFQGHPEANPGPHDMNDIFIDFIKLMKKYSS